MSRWRKIYLYVLVALVVGEMVLALGSWLYSAANPMSGIHSLLSSEGLRWLLGHFARVQATPLLVWLVLLSMGVGCVCGSLNPADGDKKYTAIHSYRERRALLLASALVLVYVGVILLLTLPPQAVLLSASGGLWPSPFSASLVPLTAFGLLLFGIVNGLVSGRFTSLSAVVDSLLSGIRTAAPLLLLYVLLIQFYESLRFVWP